MISKQPLVKPITKPSSRHFATAWRKTAASVKIFDRTWKSGRDKSASASSWRLTHDVPYLETAIPAAKLASRAAFGTDAPAARANVKLAASVSPAPETSITRRAVA